MLVFFKSVAPVVPDKVVPAADIVVETTTDALPPPPAEPLARHTDEAGPRPSDASMPTIDSTPTIHGTPVQPRTPAPLLESPNPAASLAPPPSFHSHSSAKADRPMQSQSQSALPYSPAATNSSGKDPRRFSFPSFAFLRPDAKQKKTRTIPPPLQTHPASPLVKRSKGRSLSVLRVGGGTSSERRAKESATIVRSLIVGDHDSPPSTKTKSVSKSDVARVKSQLLQPKTAAKVIAHLKTLSPHPNDIPANVNVPIHAVCLDLPDKDVHEQHFAQLQPVPSASLSAISTVLTEVHLVDLLTAPNMGFGAPVTAQGLFAGSVPTAETVIDGIEQITPQLMALGYATGKAILPNHKGIAVPTDRISALTYWWGFEICLPPPTIAFLEVAEDPCSTILGLLTALSVLSEGVREILPFIRYISQFVKCEWGTIKRADEGKGVVCTATWLLPVALVPRPWDFADAPPPNNEVVAAGQSTPTSPSVKRFSTTLTTPKPSTEVPNNGAPRSSSAYSAETREDEESRPAISSEPPVLPELVVSSPGSIDGAHRGSGDGEVHNAYEKVQHDGEATAH